jgi:rhodanese-related sulfurtransferase
MPQAQPPILKQSSLPMAAMLVASILLGVAYNNASPLGVHGAKPEEKAATVAAMPPATAHSRTGYANETISLTVEGARNPRPAGGPYGNQTVKVGLEPAQAAQTAPASPPAKDSFPSLAWPEVQTLLKNPQNLLVDARVAYFYQAEHIPGAVSLPANSSAEELTAFAAKYPKATPLIIYCGSPSCPMAHNLADLLAGQYGYSNIKLMPGGFAEYRVAEAQPGAGGGK